jgi:vacuolar-type H+-ATPase subunit H
LENIIKQVIETEYRAQKIVREAEKEQKQTSHDLEAEINSIKDKIFYSAKQKAEAVKAKELKYAKEQSDTIMSEAYEKASSMRIMLEKNRESLVKNLYDSVLNYSC